MKRRKTVVVSSFILLLLVLSLSLSLSRFEQKLAPHKIEAAPIAGRTHLVGGFSIDTPQAVANAAEDGIQVGFEYNQPPSNQDSLGQALASSHMSVIDGYIASTLYHYECHRIAVLKPTLLGTGQYCPDDAYPSLNSEQALLDAIATHLQQVKDNHLIIGYWVLDDWVQWDAGSARSLLIKIHQLIQQYTPGRPAICGFGAEIGINQEYEWADWVADNFSPQGCDEVGLYVYSILYTDKTPASPTDAYNWSMAGLLPAMFASLQKRGWDITKELLIGIGQAFGGPTDHSTAYRPIPDAQSIETQSSSFCQHGASGLAFYGWDVAGPGSTISMPMNSAAISAGIRDGIAACKQYWSS